MSTETKTNPIMTYEGWRITFQSSEQAARSAYNDFMNLWKEHLAIKKIWEATSDYLMAEQNEGFANEHGGLDHLKTLMRDAVESYESETPMGAKQ